jgi:anti-sigma factor RsiW
MKPCHERTNDILRYLDDELNGEQLKDLFAHLKVCTNCITWIEEQQALSRILRQSRPLYPASAELRARIAETIDQHSISNKQNNPFQKRFAQILKQYMPDFAQLAPRLKVLVPALIVFIVCLALVPNVVRQVHAASYVEAAVSTHRSFLTGALPLEIRSSSPGEITTWLANKVPFPFRLPDSELDPDSTPAYRLIGARLVDYKGSPAALVTYEGTHLKDTISLLVAPGNSAVVAGGDEVHSGNLIFHYRNNSGFKVITWSTHGLSYALVSNVAGSAQESCLVCHQNMADHDAFRPQQ